MNKLQRKILLLAGNVSLIAFSAIAATISTVAWYGGTQTVTATNLTIACQKAEDSITWNILKYSDDQKAGICYHDESEFYLPPYDQYIASKNIYSNVLLRVNVHTPSGFDEAKQLYIDVTCNQALYQAAKIAPYTSNICQFKATVANYTTFDGEVVETNTAIDMTNDDTQYRTVSSFFTGTSSGAVPFVTLTNQTPTKDRDNKITVIPRFFSGDDEIQGFTVFLECSYRNDLVEYYVNNHNGSDVSGETIDLAGDISEIDFRFGDHYSGAYVKVDSQSDITTQDDYIIAYENYETAFDGSGTRAEHYNNSINYIPVEINRSMIRNSETVNHSDFNYSSNYNLHSHEGFNIGATSATGLEKGMSASRATDFENTLTYVDGEVRTENNSMYMRYDTNRNQTRFNYFRNQEYLGSEGIQYYKYEDTEAANSVLTGIIISGTYKTNFTIGEVFNHEGMVVTAQYSDGSTSPVQSKCVWTGYNMNAATNQTISVSYTEDGITANAEYRISITSGPTVTVTPSILIGLAGDFGILRARSSFFDGEVTYTWSVNDISVASLSSEHGDNIEVSYLKSGYCTVTCVAEDTNGNTDSTTVNVRVSGEITDADTYVKVTSNDQLTAGEYLIVNELNNVAFNGSLEALDVVNNYLTVVIKDSMIAATAETNAAAFTYNPGDAVGEGTFLSTQSKYIGYTSTRNGLSTSDTPLYNTVSVDGEGNASIVSSGGSTLKFNDASNQMRFRYYATGQKSLCLYKKTSNNANLRLISIQLRGEFKTDFYARDRFEIGQGRVYAKYNNNSMRDVTELCTFSGYNMNLTGIQTVTVSLTQLGETRTAQYTITIRRPTLTGLSVDASQAKTSFDIGSHFSTSGLQVIATYSNGSRSDVVNDCDISGYPQDMDVLGEHTVTVSYTEGDVTLSGTYTITIVPLVDGFKLVTSADDLQNGDHVVIAAADSNFAISKTQNSNNRGQQAVTKSGNYLTYEGNSVAVFVISVEANGTFAFYDPANNGYIYAASSGSNYLRTKETLDDNGRWAVTANGSGVATMSATGTFTRKNLKYNKTSSLFSCYASGQFDIALYRYVGEYVEPVVHVTRINLNQSFIDLITGNTYQLVATCLPSDAAEKRVTYLSSDTNVLTVDENGLITSVAPGTATVTVTSVDSPDVKAVATVSVTDPFVAVTSIVVDSPNQTLDVGDTVQLSAHVLPLDATVQDVSWSTDDRSVAEVTEQGLVTAKAPGTVWMTVYAADNSAIYGQVQVIVRGGEYVAVTGVDLGVYDNQTVTLDVDDTLQLTANITPSNATNKAVTWASTDDTKVTVSSTGLVTAIAPTNGGSVLISATSVEDSSLYGMVEIIVNQGVVPPTPTTWTLVTDVATLADGQQIIIAALGSDYAMTTNQKTSNRGADAVIKNGSTNTLTFTTSIAVFTLGSETGGSWSFYDPDNSGYIYCSSSKSSSSLKTQTTNDSNGYWTITIASTGAATITSVGKTTRNILKYNDSQSSNLLFSCYTTGQKDVCLYVNTGAAFVRSAIRMKQSSNRSISNTITFVNNINSFFSSIITVEGINQTILKKKLSVFTNNEIEYREKANEYIGCKKERSENYLWQINVN